MRRRGARPKQGEAAGAEGGSSQRGRAKRKSRLSPPSKIELEDGRTWDVDDARHADGKIYDLDLSLDPVAVIKRKPDWAGGLILRFDRLAGRLRRAP